MDNNTNLIFSGGRQTGSVKRDTYFRTMKANHFLKFPEVSIAVSVDVLDQLKERNVIHLEFRHSETNTRYRCTLDHFLECGVKLNRGYGDQVSLPLTGFVTTGANLQPVYNDAKMDTSLPEKARKQLAFQGWM